MHGPNQWPDERLLPGWRAAVWGYYAAMGGVARRVAEGIALSLGLPRGFFEDKLDDPVAQMLLLKYPPDATAAAAAAADGSIAVDGDVGVDEAVVAVEAAAAGAGGGACRRVAPLGCGAHTDCGFLTLLAQGNVPGLEVLTRQVRTGAVFMSCVQSVLCSSDKTTNYLYTP